MGEYSESLFVFLQVVLKDLVVLVFGNFVFQLPICFSISLLNFLYFFVFCIIDFFLSPPFKLYPVYLPFVFLNQLSLLLFEISSTLVGEGKFQILDFTLFGWLYCCDSGDELLNFEGEVAVLGFCLIFFLHKTLNLFKGIFIFDLEVLTKGYFLPEFFEFDLSKVKGTVCFLMNSFNFMFSVLKEFYPATCCVNSFIWIS